MATIQGNRVLDMILEGQVPWLAKKGMWLGGFGSSTKPLVPELRMLTLGMKAQASSPPNNFFSTSSSPLQRESVDVPVPSAYVDFAGGNDGFAEMSKAAHQLFA